MLNRIFEICATLGTIIGFYLVSESQILIGFSISLLANFLWMLWATDSDAKGIFLVNSVMAIVACNGILGAI